jgi:cation diffusion facilitator family transporter
MSEERPTDSHSHSAGHVHTHDHNPNENARPSEPRHSDHRDGHGGHGHAHGMVDPSISGTDEGIWAVKWSFVGLFITASIQLVVVFLSGSVALLADAIHNFGDAATAIPLGIAFLFAKRKPTARFNYGFGRVEDLAGLALVLIIFASAGVAFYQSVERLLHPRPVTHIMAIVVASIIGFLGNEGVAVFRIRVGRKIGSAALTADGYHARTDGWTSLAVLVGALGVYFGYPKADPIIGLLITVAILAIVWQSVKLVVTRMLDGVEPETAKEIRHAAHHVTGVLGVSDIRTRWIGHRLHTEVNITVDPALSVTQGHFIARKVEGELLGHLQFLSSVIIHVDPASEPGEHFHRSTELPAKAFAPKPH